MDNPGEHQIIAWSTTLYKMFICFQQEAVPYNVMFLDYPTPVFVFLAHCNLRSSRPHNTLLITNYLFVFKYMKTCQKHCISVPITVCKYNVMITECLENNYELLISNRNMTLIIWKYIRIQSYAYLKVQRAL